MMRNKESPPLVVAHKGFSKFMTLAAIVLSWSISKSFWWAMLHGILGGFYVVYWLIVHAELPKYIAERFL